jgi:hypothetical protein
MSFRIAWPQAVLGVNSLNVWAKQFDRVYRIGFTVQDQIRKIEVDTLIVGSDIANRTHQRDRSLLAGLVTQVLAVAFAVCGNFPMASMVSFVQHIVGIFRNEPTVSLDSGMPHCRAKSEAFLM